MSTWTALAAGGAEAVRTGAWESGATVAGAVVVVLMVAATVSLLRSPAQRVRRARPEQRDQEERRHRDRIGPARPEIHHRSLVTG